MIRHEGRKGERGDRGVRKMGLGGDGSPPLLSERPVVKAEWPEEEKKKGRDIGVEVEVESRLGW